MPTIEWNAVGEKGFETGLDHGVLYPKEGPGVPWNGLTNVTKIVSGAEVRATYIDGVKFMNESAYQEYEATLQAYYYPREFERCDGIGQDENGIGYDNQPREQFGLSYRTLKGNDVQGLDYGYKIHLIYNALATPTQTVFVTLGAQPSATLFSWNISTVPVHISGFAPTAHIILDSTILGASTMAAIEDILYGYTNEPKLISPFELQNIFGASKVVPAKNLFPSMGLFPNN